MKENQEKQVAEGIVKEVQGEGKNLRKKLK